MKHVKRNLGVAGVLLVLFIGWTIAVSYVDVQAIGPEGSKVGLATLNGWFHNLTGVNWGLYDITDVFGMVPLLCCAAFAVFGLIQLIQRKSLRKVDGDILALGVFYAVVILLFVVFEILALNYRPVLIEGKLEASYPSSTTLLIMSVMPTVVMQLNRRMKNPVCKRVMNFVIIAFSIFMVVGRIIAGVHWITDIIGSMLLSSGLVLIYHSVINRKIEE